MKRLLLLSIALASSVLLARPRDFVLEVNPAAGKSAPGAAKTVPGVAYRWDKSWCGDESRALACRRQGVWLVRMDAIDLDSLKFMARYDLRAVLPLSSDSALDELKGLRDAGVTNAVAGFVLPPCAPGEETSYAGKWSRLMSFIDRSFNRPALALPLWEPSQEANFSKAFGMRFGRITHVVVSLPDDALTSWDALEGLRTRFLKPAFGDKRVWVCAPKAGSGGTRADDFKGMLWRMHLVLTSLADEHVDAVFLADAPSVDGALGAALRYLARAVRLCPSVVRHGESQLSESANDRARRDRTVSDDIELDGEGVELGDVGEEMNHVTKREACRLAGEALKSGTFPAACDVECLALVGNGYIAVLAVNATPQTVTVTIDGKFRSHFSCETRTVRCAPDGRTALCDCREDWSVPSERIRIYAEANTFQVTVVPIR